MTWAAMDVHASSTYAASLDVMTGEVARQRFDTGAVEPVVSWLTGLPGAGACVLRGRPPGNRRESHPPAPTDPHVSLSTHTARAVQLSGRCAVPPVHEQLGFS